MNGERACLEEDDRMPGKAEAGESPEGVFYGQHHARIDSELAAEIRRERKGILCPRRIARFGPSVG